MPNKALLVGVNDYAPVGAGGPDLRGCVNDVRDMATTLVSLGVVPLSPLYLRILTDANARKANIVAGLQWLITGAKAGETRVFYYSGHGSYVADVSGDEPDHRDETICPHDYATAGQIKDDDLRSIIARLPANVNLDVIFDSCHSGTATRALDAAPPEGTVRFIEPSLDESFFAEGLPGLRVLGSRKVEAKERVPVPAVMNHVLWAACRDNQTSMETNIGGAIRGVFTYYFCRRLRAAGPAGIRRYALDRLVTGDIRTAGYAQVPQMEGAPPTFTELMFK